MNLARISLSIMFIAGFVAGALLTLLPEPAIAQPASVEPELNAQDQIAVRHLYRVHPGLAGELEDVLKSGSTEEARKESLRKFSLHLNVVIDRGKNFPGPYRQADWDVVAKIAEYAFRQVWHQEDMLSSEPLQIEDDMIRLASFRDYEELYDFLRERPGYGPAFGLKYLRDMEILKRDDRAKYIEELHKLIDELKVYRSRKTAGRTLRVKPGDVVVIEDRPAGAKTTKTTPPSDRE